MIGTSIRYTGLRSTELRVNIRARPFICTCPLSSKLSFEARLWEVLSGGFISHHGLFFSLQGPTNSGERARFLSVFRDARDFGRQDAGSRAGFISPRPPSPWTSNFLIYIHTTCALEKLGLVDQNCLERDFLSALSLENAGRE